MEVSNSILHTRPLRVAVGYLTIAKAGSVSDWSARSGWSWLSRISSWYRGVVHLLHPLGPTSGETHLSDSAFPTIALDMPGLQVDLICFTLRSLHILDTVTPANDPVPIRLPLKLISLDHRPRYMST